MAGIEQLEVHSKSYIVRWVKVDQGFSISWNLQPHKKSLNFGIVKHPGSGGTNLTAAIPDIDSTSQTTVAEAKSKPFAKKDASTAQDQLAAKGFIPIKWHGKCEADKVSMGIYDVGPGQGGMYGLVFDNTFSKQTGKTATFVLLIYPTDSPPQTTHHLPNLGVANKASASSTSLGRHGSPALNPVAAGSFDSLHSHGPVPGGGSVSGRGEAPPAPSTYHVGNLLKRRRKKGQGYARRFFSLDYSSCTLSYYHNRGSSALRGAIPLSLAAIAADESRREISIDSGAEVWHLKASNAKEFTEWARGLERASRIARGLEAAPQPATAIPRLQVEAAQALRATAATKLNPEEEKEWEQVETLVSRIVGTRDALRRLVKDIANQSQGVAPSVPPTSTAASSPPAADSASQQTLTPPAVPEKRPFWKRKPSSPSLSAQAAAQGSTSPAPGSSSTNLAVPSPLGITTTISSAGTIRNEKRRSRSGQHGSLHHHHSHPELTTEEHCQALLTDLDSVLTEFTTLISRSKRRRQPEHPHSPALSRKSIESTTTDEFFDAEQGGESDSRIVRIQRDQDELVYSDADYVSVHSSSGSSTMTEEDPSETVQSFPAKPKSLAPLPINEVVKRRTAIPPATTLPPSLIAFFRKNVGKDLSTISMPVSANEPVSLLQKVAEQLEYAQLLDQAAQAKTEKDRMLLMAAFAVSQFSNARAKERSIRKPFNPLLGETFELVRTESDSPGGFRLLVEKVCHRPVRLAMHADAENWSFTQAPAPSQKFWGKSAEINTEGRVRVALRLAADGSDEFYSWTIATMFLRNVVVGEKYVEPVGTMTVLNESTGAKAVVEFRSKGMFGGRGEDVQVETFDSSGKHTGSSLSGTWTGSLRVVEAGKSAGREIWKAGALVENAARAYGMTAFAAGLNEITKIEDGRLPPTDARLRPDQRLAEQGNLDEAEDWKVRLEEAQRARRRVMEESGEEHKPRWFVKVADGAEGDEIWKIKGGKEGYWEERSKGAWSGVEKIFDA